MSNLFDQHQFNKLIRDQMGNTNLNNIDPNNLDLSWIDKYVSDTIEKAFSRTSSTSNVDSSKPTTNTNTGELKTDLLDIHHYLIAKIYIPKHIDHKKIKLGLNSNKLKIKGLPSGNSQTIDLPTHIDTYDTKAIYKNQILEVRMPKVPDDDEDYNSVKVHFDD
ncbi:Hsp20/alpha crystallin family protein [Chengkuizengella sediminis]|uniref:Hsp20/alpha crystallin family protein n=1 Tax=Chengkuizengella sediminis TaxID=1885917 RepID=UPI0013895A98|nr:hypothetical protein [Chengkuizengella sediminis]NDI37206.1 hypothetical protein [Chengkuizengella sediminis]